MEQTLVVVKPDGVARGLIGQIVSRFERVGLKIVAAKMVQIDTKLAEKHYPADREEFLIGMGNKTLENYKDMKLDAKNILGTDDPKKIGELVRTWLLEFITSGPVFAFVLEGHHAIELVRKMAGHTLPIKAEPGTIRGDFTYDSAFLGNAGKRAIKNIIHASGNSDEAKFEVGLWFQPKELVDYRRIEHDVMF